MIKPSDTVNLGDPFDLRRFLRAQEGIYDAVLAELRRGQKRTHWMWFIFPQIEGLAYSTTSKRARSWSKSCSPLRYANVVAPFPFPFIFASPSKRFLKKKRLQMGGKDDVIPD